MLKTTVSRRRFLALTAAGAGAAVLDACGPAAAPTAASPTSAAASPTPTATSSKLDELVRQAKVEGQVVMWIDQPQFDDTLAKLETAFNAKFGTSIKIQQSRGVSGGQAVSKIIAESQAGLHSTDFTQLNLEQLLPLIDAGQAAAYPWTDVFGDALPGIKEAAAPLGITGLADAGPLRYWDSATGILYNTTRIKEADLPRTWNEVADPKFSGQFSTDGRGLPFQWLMLHPDWGTKKTEDLVRGIAKNKPLKGQGVVAVADPVQRGEVAFGLSFPHFVVQGTAKGAPVAWKALDYVPVVRLIAVVPKTPAHPAASRLFAAWLVTEGVKIMEPLEGFGRLSDTNSATYKAVMAAGASTKVAEYKTLDDIKNAAAFLKTAADIFAGVS